MRLQGSPGYTTNLTRDRYPGLFRNDTFRILVWSMFYVMCLLYFRAMAVCVVMAIELGRTHSAEVGGSITRTGEIAASSLLETYIILLTMKNARRGLNHTTHVSMSGHRRPIPVR